MLRDDDYEIRADADKLETTPWRFNSVESQHVEIISTRASMVSAKADRCAVISAIMAKAYIVFMMDLGDVASVQYTNICSIIQHGSALISCRS